MEESESEVTLCQETKKIRLGDHAEAVLKCGLTEHTRLVRHHAQDRDPEQDLTIHYLWG